MEKYHLTALIDTIRHGEKDSAGQLTLQGHLQAALRAVSLTDLRGDVHLCHSGAPRVLNTIRMARQLLSHNVADTLHQNFQVDVQKCMENCALPSASQETKHEGLHFMLDPSQKSAYFSTWTEQPTPQEAAARAQKLLDLHDLSPEPGIIPSPKEMAQRVGKVLLEQIRRAMGTPFSQRENYLNGTHEPVVLAFLGYMFSNFEKPAPDFVHTMGGAIDFTEGFQIQVYQSEQNAFKLQCVFRNLMTVFTVEELEAFVHSLSTIEGRTFP